MTQSGLCHHRLRHLLVDHIISGSRCDLTLINALLATPIRLHASNNLRVFIDHCLLCSYLCLKNLELTLKVWELRGEGAGRERRRQMLRLWSVMDWNNLLRLMRWVLLLTNLIFWLVHLIAIVTKTYIPINIRFNIELYHLCLLILMRHIISAGHIQLWLWYLWWRRYHLNHLKFLEIIRLWGDHLGVIQWRCCSLNHLKVYLGGIDRIQGHWSLNVLIHVRRIWLVGLIA